MKMHNVITDNCEIIRPEYQPATVPSTEPKLSIFLNKKLNLPSVQFLFSNSFKKYLALYCFLVSITLLNAYVLVKTAFE